MREWLEISAIQYEEAFPTSHDMMRSTKNLSLTIHHKFNPLHIYCRLAKLGIRRESAFQICEVYERTVFRLTKRLLLYIAR